MARFTGLGSNSCLKIFRGPLIKLQITRSLLTLGDPQDIVLEQASYKIPQVTVSISVFVASSWRNGTSACVSCPVSGSIFDKN